MARSQPHCGRTPPPARHPESSSGQTDPQHAIGFSQFYPVIATKFGNTFDEATRTRIGTDVSAGHIRAACQACLDRLGTDRIDSYQLHCDAEPEQVDDILTPLGLLWTVD